MEVEIDTEANSIEASKKDPKAFEAIYNRYFDQIFLFINKRLMDEESAFDVTQQVFFNALTNLKQYQYRGVPFASFLYKIAINECNQYFRDQRKVRHVSINEEAIEGFSEEVFSIDRTERAMEQLAKVIQSLKHEELTLIELRYFEQRSYMEIAEILGRSVSNCKVQVHRIIKKLKKNFRHEE